MASRSSVIVPAARRPRTVERALQEVDGLADRVGEATTAVETAQATLEDAERVDRETAAAALRRGGEAKISNEPAAVAKTRDRVTAARRELDILKLAATAAEADLETAIGESAADWSAELDDAEQDARRRVRELLGELETVIRTVAETASAHRWLVDGGSLDRGRKVAPFGGVAPSSTRHSANGSPFTVEQLLGWLAEAVDPPVAGTSVRLVTPADVA
jgi:hypothetical protein